MKVRMRVEFAALTGLVLLLSPLALASGRGAGNGGDVIVCRSGAGAITRIELLDYFEARTAGMTLSMGAPDLSIEQKLELAMQRLLRFGARRVEQYRASAAEFLSSAEFVRGKALIDIPDERVAVIPAGCQLEQIAIQRTRLLLPTDRRLTINADLWDLLSTDDKAGLILHELFYGEALQIAHGRIAHTPSVRALTGLFSSPQAESLSLQEATDRFSAAGIAWLGWNEAELMLFSADGTSTSPEFYPNGNLKKARFAPQHAPFWHRVNSEIDLYCDPECEGLRFSPEGIPGYSEYSDRTDGFLGHVKINRPGFVVSTGDRASNPPVQLAFYKNGDPWQVSKAKIELDRESYQLVGDESTVWFHGGGLVHLAKAIRGWVKFDDQGKVEIGHQLVMNQYGQVLQAYFETPVNYSYQGRAVQLRSLLRKGRWDSAAQVSAACFVAPETIEIVGQKIQVQCIDRGDESSGYQPVFRSAGTFEIKRFKGHRLLIDGVQGFTSSSMCLARDEVIQEIDGETRKKKKTLYKQGTRLRISYSGFDWVSGTAPCRKTLRTGWSP
jgi:hypothetical protein